MITESILKKHGSTNGCPKCENFGSLHSAECRHRIEKLMVESGDAFVQRDQIKVEVKTETPAQPDRDQAQSQEALTSSSSSSSNNDSEDNKVEVELTEGYVAVLAKMETPEVDISKDWRTWKCQKFLGKQGKKEERLRFRT